MIRIVNKLTKPTKPSARYMSCISMLASEGVPLQKHARLYIRQLVLYNQIAESIVCLPFPLLHNTHVEVLCEYHFHPALLSLTLLQLCIVKGGIELRGGLSFPPSAICSLVWSPRSCDSNQPKCQIKVYIQTVAIHKKLNSSDQFCDIQ